LLQIFLTRIIQKPFILLNKIIHTWGDLSLLPSAVNSHSKRFERTLLHLMYLMSSYFCNHTI